MNNGLVKICEMEVEQHVRFNLTDNEGFMKYPSILRSKGTLFMPTVPNFPYIDKIYTDLSKSTVYFISDTINSFSMHMQRDSSSKKGIFDDSVYEIERFAHTKDIYFDYATKSKSLKTPRSTTSNETLTTMAAIYLDLIFNKKGHSSELEEKKANGSIDYHLKFYDPQKKQMDNIFYIYFSGMNESNQKLINISNVWYVEQGEITNEFRIIF